MSTEAKVNTASKLSDQIIGLELKLTKKEEDDKIANTEIVNKLDEIIVLMKNMKAPRTASNKPAAAIPSEKKFPTNSMYWVKEMYRANKDDVITKFFDNSVRTAIDTHMNSSTELQNKQAEARVTEEFKYLWQKHAMNGKVVKDKIRTAYEKALKNHNNNTVVQAKEDDGDNHIDE
jgi:hypothetical protein